MRPPLQASSSHRARRLMITRGVALRINWRRLEKIQIALVFAFILLLTFLMWWESR